MVRVGVKPGGGDDVEGEHDIDAAPCRLRKQVPHLGNLVGLEHRAADLVPLGLEEGVRHAAADQQPVRAAKQTADYGKLVRRLRRRRERRRKGGQGSR